MTLQYDNQLGFRGEERSMGDQFPKLRSLNEGIWKHEVN